MAKLFAALSVVALAATGFMGNAATIVFVLFFLAGIIAWLGAVEAKEDRQKAKEEQMERAIRHRKIQDFARRQELERWKECDDEKAV